MIDDDKLPEEEKPPLVAHRVRVYPPSTSFRHLGKLEREVPDDSWKGREPPEGPHMKLAMLAWLADRLDNNAPKRGVPVGALGKSNHRGWLVLIVIVVVLLGVAMIRGSSEAPVAHEAIRVVAPPPPVQEAAPPQEAPAVSRRHR